MVKRGLLFLVSLILALSFVSPIETETTIIINTVPNFTVNAFFIESGSGPYSLIEMINEDSGPNGKSVFTLRTGKNDFNLKVHLKKDGETHFSYEFEETFITGEPIELDLYPKWYQPKNLTEEENLVSNSTLETNETLEEENATLEAENLITPKQKSISGNAIKITGRTAAYAGGIIVLIVLIILFIRWKKKFPKEPKEIKIKKLSDVQNQNDDEIKRQQSRIEETRKALKEEERKLQEMQNPNMGKIEAAKRKLIEDEKELIRLRKEAQKDQE